jgi:hypothetical protein
VDRESVAKTVRLDMPYLQARIDSDRARNRFKFFDDPVLQLTGL